MKINLHQLQKSSVSWRNEWRDNSYQVYVLILIIWPLNEHKSQTNAYRSFDQVTTKLIPAPALKSVITLFWSRSTKYPSRLVPALKKMNTLQGERMNKWEELRFPLVLGAAVESTVSQTKSCAFLQLLRATGSSLFFFYSWLLLHYFLFLLNCEHFSHVSFQRQLSLCFLSLFDFLCF